MSSGCNERNGEFLGEDMPLFFVTFRLSNVDECNTLIPFVFVDSQMYIGNIWICLVNGLIG